MIKPTILEAFCLLAEAQQTAANAGLLKTRSSEVSLNLGDMTALAREIRALQECSAELEPIAGPDGEVDIVLEDVTVATLYEFDHLQTWTFNGHPVRVTGKLARPPVPATPVEPRADTDGWIEWGGGECPINDNVRVDLKFRGGSIAGWDLDVSARYARWNHINSDGDIVAYRVHRAAAPISNPPATPNADGFYSPSTKPATPGVYRTWFMRSNHGGFSHWDGSNWGHEWDTAERAYELVGRFVESARQDKHWQPL